MFVSRIGISLGVIIGAATLTLPMTAYAATDAAQSVTKTCSTQYKAAKKNKTLKEGEKWPQFLSACSAQLKTDQGSSAAASTTAAADTAEPAKKSRSKKAAKETSSERAPHTPTQICNAQYKDAKAANTLGGKKKKEFVSDCKASIQNDHEDTGVVPAEPAASPKSAAASKPMGTTSANGKPLTAGQIAFRQRIRECGNEWHQAKAANKIRAGEKWPQFWSACNTRLKKEK